MPDTPVAPVMRQLVWSEMTDTERRLLVTRGLDDIIPAGLRDSIVGLIEDVRLRGDAAVCDALAKFDHTTVRPGGLRATDAEFAAAAGRLAPSVLAAIDDMIEHLHRFNSELRKRSENWGFETEPGLWVGEKTTPISSAGLFCPSGKASYPSVIAQLGTPAVVAGVPEIVVVVPPAPGTNGEIDPAVLVVCERLGIRNVFRVNGPAGIAALGFGTESIPKVRKIVGPGSPAVTCAQVEMQRFGVATMMVLGPTESLVIADDTADPVRLAADLLIEAEHGTDSCTVLLTTSAPLAAATEVELQRQIAGLPAARAEAARASLGVNGGCILVDSLGIAASISNQFAPEHLQIAVAQDAEEDMLEMLVNAGEILVGQHTPFSAANFVIGCPASLPTSGFAHVSSGITVETFLKRTAIAKADLRAARRMAPSVIALAEHEGFPAHAAALRLRQEG
ncbi:MAG: histidinol dehydrogenase [Actinobacteria bacterium]|nr:histidinol dehydrogenase [Actinomycetota bacterium]MSZ03288.1 histidinol dehydrogenase [Actinomycetota bacterium]MTB05811.1 histidinol dehydrogenase [Actinomycetota bacterium]